MSFSHLSKSEFNHIFTDKTNLTACLIMRENPNRYLTLTVSPRPLLFDQNFIRTPREMGPVVIKSSVYAKHSSSISLNFFKSYGANSK